MSKPHEKDDTTGRAGPAATGDPTLELESAASGDGGHDEFDGPTQLVDPGAYAATVSKTQRSEEQDADETELRQPRGDADDTVIRASSSSPTSGGLFPDTGLQLPQRLGQYTLVELLGLGGMAEVFRAQQDGPSGFRRELVIKRIHPHLSIDERFVQMFLREARVAQGLQHRNIVRIDELGVDKGIYFIAMELVDGLTLQRLARRAWRSGLSVPMELIVAAAADAATALNYAHSYIDPDGSARRIVHRDVSPDNLIIDRAGNTKLLDFGVAKAAGSISVTRAGEVKGKVPYMAPEQLHGRPLDGRSDLYSLGATLYWLLTGKRPFRGETDLEVMQAIAYQEPVPPRELNGEIPEVLERVVLRLLSKQPDGRHANGQQLADELTAMVLPSRRDVASFVEEAMALDKADDNDPISVSSFIAATPRTTHFVAESRRLWLERYLPEEDGAAPSVPAAPEPTETARFHDDMQLLADADLEELEEADVGDGDPGALQASDAPEPERRATAPLGPLGLEDAAVVEPHAAPTPDVPPRRLPVTAMGAGAAAAVVLAGIGWALSGSDEPALRTLPSPAVMAASGAGKDGKAGGDGDWSFLGEEPSTLEGARDDDTERPTSDDEHTQAGAAEKRAPQVTNPGAGMEHTVATNAGENDDDVAERTQRASAGESEGSASRQQAHRAAIPTITVEALGPASVAWRLGRRTLGTGSTTLQVPEGTTALSAYHRTRKVRTRIPVRNGKVSYDDAPTGTLDIRVVPYATIYAGSEKLWKVPAPPRAVPTGTYTLRIEYDGRSKTETVVVEKGGTAKVRVNMMAP